MKANAPEKLYVDVRDNLSDSMLYGFTEKSRDEDIEYTRTDAFIEKVCDWLRNNSHNYANNALGKEYLVNDLRNYMKGE